jgi:hypothetical protein
MHIDIEILDVSALKTLQRLADDHLIIMKEHMPSDFQAVVDKLRRKAEKCPPSLEMIGSEVEKVRVKRHARRETEAGH